ncbi:MAG TPA: folate-binding protein YgfZ [Paracoccus sp.]|nr:folate-binding protein YgfZ [Paracoccus sp. (in: a-proteobacteria)]
MTDTEIDTSCAPAPGRAILRIGGPDGLSFLQGLVTNDVHRLADAGIVYAALLTPQGKFLADFFLVAQGDDILLDTDAALADDLLKRLTLYRLRSKVVIERVDMTVTRGIGPAPQRAFADPRHPAMGWRLYGESLSTGAPVDWAARRVRACVPETGAELVAGESYILELGFERLHGVDFRKGCYVGQEVTARMHHKTELRKGLVQVGIEGAAEPGAQITTGDGKPAGVLHTRAGNRALAWLRHDRATGPLRAAGAVVHWPAPEGGA